MLYVTNTYESMSITPLILLDVTCINDLIFIAMLYVVDIMTQYATMC